jgi:hypothetical protein
MPLFLDVSPFFRMAPSRFQSQQILFLTEFSRFMNRQAPNMLKVIQWYSYYYQNRSFHHSILNAFLPVSIPQGLHFALLFFGIQLVCHWGHLLVLRLVETCRQSCPAVLPGSLARQSSPAVLPGSLARQSCPAVLPGSLARQSCPAVLPGSLVRQSCPVVWPGSLAQQSCPAVLHGSLARQSCLVLVRAAFETCRSSDVYNYMIFYIIIKNGVELIWYLWELLQDFVDRKKIYQAERTLQKLKRYEFSQLLGKSSGIEVNQGHDQDFTDPK